MYFKSARGQDPLQKYSVLCTFTNLMGKGKQVLIAGRQGILLMHRITNLSNANATFSASINGGDYVDFKVGMLIEQLTVWLMYFQIMFVKEITEKKNSCNAICKVPFWTLLK